MSSSIEIPKYKTQSVPGKIALWRRATQKILGWLGGASREEIDVLSAQVQHLSELLDLVACETCRLKEIVEEFTHDEASAP